MEKKDQENQPNQLELHKLVKEKFKDYRNSGIAFSVTIISLSSALIVWANNILTNAKNEPLLKCCLSFQVIFLTLTIFSCLFIQFSNYQGYKHEARYHLGQSKIEKATYWFSKEDFAVYLSVLFFIIGVCISTFVFFKR